MRVRISSSISMERLTSITPQYTYLFDIGLFLNQLLIDDNMGFQASERQFAHLDKSFRMRSYLFDHARLEAIVYRFGRLRLDKIAHNNILAHRQFREIFRLHQPTGADVRTRAAQVPEAAIEGKCRRVEMEQIGRAHV